MRTISALAAAAVMLAGCAVSVPMTSKDEDRAGKSFAPPPAGMASLYVFREGALGAPYALDATMGQRTLGALGPDTWFLVDVPPGSYDVRCVAENTSSARVTLAPGETRFVELAVRIGIAKHRCAAFEVAPEVGRKAVLAGERAAEVR